MRMQLASSFVLATAGAVFAQKIPEVRIGSDPAGRVPSQFPSIAANDEGVFVAWVESVPPARIHFSRSLDAGASWAPDQQLNTSVAWTHHPKLAVSGQNVFVAWQDSRSIGSSLPDVYFNRSSDGGATWLPSDVRLSTGTVTGVQSNTVRIAADGSLVCVVWVDRRNAIGNGRDVYCNLSQDGGATWLASDVRLNTNAIGSAFLEAVRVAVRGDRIGVVWRDTRTGGNDAYGNFSSDGGATWLASDVKINQGPSSAHFAELAFTANSVHVAWQDTRANSVDIYVNRSTDDGATWNPTDTRIDSGGFMSSYLPKIAAAGSNVYVAWHDGRNHFSRTDVYCNHSNDDGLTWQPSDRRLDTDAPGDAESDSVVIAASDDAAFVAWNDLRNGQTDVYLSYTKDSGSTWSSSDVRLNTNAPGASISWGPQVAAHDGLPYVAFMDKRDGPDDLFFNVPFAAHEYGIGTPGFGGVTPSLTATGRATLGELVTLTSEQGLANATSAFFLGVGTATRTSFPILGGTLLVLPTVSLPYTASATGDLVWPFTLTTDPAFLGENLNFQTVHLDGAAPQGVSMSNAIEVWIGE